jgi:hypothetical protein
LAYCRPAAGRASLSYYVSTWRGKVATEEKQRRVQRPLEKQQPLDRRCR